MRQLLRYLSHDENMIRFKRKAAIFIGFNVLLIMTMLVAICAMERRTSEQGLYVGLSIAGCLWIAIAIVLAVHYSTKVWPSVLIYVTSVVYLATVFTLGFSHHVVFVHQVSALFLLVVCWYRPHRRRARYPQARFQGHVPG